MILVKFPRKIFFPASPPSPYTHLSTEHAKQFYVCKFLYYVPHYYVYKYFKICYFAVVYGEEIRERGESRFGTPGKSQQVRAL